MILKLSDYRPPTAADIRHQLEQGYQELLKQAKGEAK